MEQTCGLILSGGGARAAYQVGVLAAIADMRRKSQQDLGTNPFPIISGTSAGAINAAVLACGAFSTIGYLWNATEIVTDRWSAGGPGVGSGGVK